MSHQLLAWTLFVHPIVLNGRLRLFMLVPLVLCVAIVYKTIRCRNVREIPLASLVLCGTIILGMFSVGVVLWAAFRLLA